MKKDLLKTSIISAVVGAITAGSISSVVAYGIGSNQVEYTPTDNAWKVNSVSEAIDDLYIKKTGDNYSTEEKVVGTWIDGKPLYQKTIEFNYTNASVQTFNHNIDNVDIIFLDLDATFLVSNGLFWTFGRTDNNGSIVQAATIQSIDKTSITFRGWGNSGIGYATLKYTKTTDTVPTENNQG